ncbi:MAG TPA: MDR family MFS transporter [Chloroflexia bacterium]|nr:MDR family MFS transporter [Chloroflexia bacterium]
MATTAAPPPAVGLESPHPQTHKGLVITAVLLTTALSALDANIVGTAMPSIVGALRGLNLLPWLATAFLLSTAVTVPLAGKLADLYGRKPVLLAGVTIFLLGSALCGLAGSMEQLIAFRALQGLGAGTVIPVTLTLIGDLFDLEERARLQGIFSAVWGVASVLGPPVGGFIVTFWSWPWVFLINLPVGLLAMAILGVYLREPARDRTARPRLDLAGAATLSGGIIAGLLALSLLSAAPGAGAGGPVAGLAISALALLALFLYIERRAPEPLIPLDLLARPLTRVVVGAAMLADSLLLGGGIYLPILVQGVWQGTPLEAGLALAPLSLSWPVASSFSGRAIRRWGYRPVVGSGGVLIAVGALLLLPLGPAGPVWLLPGALFVQGAGFGLTYSTCLLAVQNSVPWERRGTATSLYQFARSTAGTMAGALLGLLLTTTLAAALARLPALPLPPAAGPSASGHLGAANLLLDLTARTQLAAPTKAALIGALASGLQPVILVLGLLGVGVCGIAALFPRDAARAAQ